MGRVIRLASADDAETVAMEAIGSRERKSPRVSLSVVCLAGELTLTPLLATDTLTEPACHHGSWSAFTSH